LEGLIIPAYHIAASAGAGAGVYFLSRSIPASILLFITGVFIDLDHFPDYFREAGLNLDLKRFYCMCNNNILKKAAVYLHSLEALLVFSAFMIFGPAQEWWVKGIFIGFAVHMLMDVFSNISNPLAYFLAYRISIGFDTGKIWGPVKNQKS